MKFSNLVIGNSSSGIIEAPQLGIKCINIGNRQNGRVSSRHVTNCKCNSYNIYNTIKKLLKTNKAIKDNTYPGIKTSKKIRKIIEKINFSTLKKPPFIDLA